MRNVESAEHRVGALGRSLTVAAGKVGQVSDLKTGFDLFTERSIVAMRVNGELKDLATTVTDDDVVEGIDITSEDGVKICLLYTSPSPRDS